ncbi:MAG TPA: hypothetical protein VH394_16740 [Thermoanaerobaculia bacterium]|jgi:hypothetical protein|nr:hypothetical protein [Thermoanaerobaculia bacterium]
MPKSSFADELFEWTHLLLSVEQNAGEVAYLSELTSELRTLLQGSKELDQERLALEARRQKITGEIQALRSRGRIVAARVRAGLRTRYGYGSDKLVEFGMQPRRHRTGAKRAEPEAAGTITGSEPVA